MKLTNKQTDIKFEKKENCGVNKYGHYQFGSNCCIGCKADRPIRSHGNWCDICINYNNNGHSSNQNKITQIS